MSGKYVFGGVVAKSFGVGWQILEVGVGRSTFLGGVPKNFGGKWGGGGHGVAKNGEGRGG